MSSLEVVMDKSSMNTSSKMNILSQEGGRRLRNHSLNTAWETKLIDVNKLMIQMLWSGYNYVAREIVARWILAKYHSTVNNFVIFGRPLFRSK